MRIADVRRIPLDALDVEMSIAEGEQALQVLLKFVSESAGKLEAHEAEKGIFKRLLPIGLAAMKLYFAQRGTGDLGAAVTRADGMILPRETQLRGRDDVHRSQLKGLPQGWTLGAGARGAACATA
jgi:hypothetical protein